MDVINELKHKVAVQIEQVRAESEQRLEEARAMSADQLIEARRTANRILNNATFKYIYYLFNNVIHRADTRGFVQPLLGDDISPEYQQELDQYQEQIETHQPFETVWSREQFGSVRYRMLSGLKQTEAPLPPLPPISFSNTGAVADFVVVIQQIHTRKEHLSDRIYFSRWAAPFEISSMDLDGGNVAMLWSGERPVTSLAMDGEQGELYWLEGNQQIKKALITANGPGEVQHVLDIEAPDKGGLWQLELDLYNRKIYWTNDISIWRTDMDTPDPASTSRMVISPAESPFPIDLVVDGQNGYLYWIDKELKYIRRSDLEGVTIEDLYPVNVPTKGLKVDPIAHFVYWSDQVDKNTKLLRAPTQEKLLYFDGKTDYIELPQIDEQVATVEMWINPEEQEQLLFFIEEPEKEPIAPPPGVNYVMQAQGGGKATAAFLFTVGGISLNPDGSMTNQYHLTYQSPMSTDPTNIGLIPGGMFHLAITNDDQQASIYINGKLKVTRRNYFLPKGKWYWGGTGQDRSGYFKGSFAELRIWDQVRSEEVIRAGLHFDYRGDEAGLIGYWRTDRLQNKILPDLTNSNYDGVLRRKGMKSPVEKSIPTFELAGNGVKLPSMEFVFRQGITIECWVKFKKFKFDSRILEQGNGEGSNYIILGNHETSGDLKLTVSKAGEAHEITASGVFELDQWIHVACTINTRSEARIYKNGRLIEGPHPFVMPPQEVRTQNYLGKTHTSWGQAGDFEGKLAEVRMWNRAMAAHEIATNRHRQMSTQEENLYACWPLDEGQGKIALCFPNTRLQGTYETDDLVFESELLDAKGRLSQLRDELNQLKLDKNATSQSLNQSQVQFDQGKSTIEPELQEKEPLLQDKEMEVSLAEQQVANYQLTLDEKDQLLQGFIAFERAGPNKEYHIGQARKEVDKWNDTLREVEEAILKWEESLQLWEEVDLLEKQIEESYKKMQESYPIRYTEPEKFNSLEQAWKDFSRLKWEKFNEANATGFQHDQVIKYLEQGPKNLIYYESRKRPYQEKLDHLESLMELAPLYEGKEREEFEVAVEEAKQDLEKSKIDVEKLQEDYQSLLTEIESLRDTLDSNEQVLASAKATFEEASVALIAFYQSQNAELQHLEEEVPMLEVKVRKGQERIWSIGEIPVNPVVKQNYQIEEVLPVHGMDGLGLVPEADFLKARRSEAYRQLHLTEEQAEKDLHAAMLAENARLEEAQAKHNQRMAEAQQQEDDAKKAADARRAKADRDKRQAENEANRRIQAAQNDASQTRRNAMRPFIW